MNDVTSEVSQYVPAWSFDGWLSVYLTPLLIMEQPATSPLFNRVFHHVIDHIGGVNWKTKRPYICPVAITLKSLFLHSLQGP